MLSAMAQGDFSVSPGMQYMGSFEEINRSFRMIQETLSGIILNINTSSADVSAGAQQMSDASQLSAEGTAKQATAVDELSATIADISDNIVKTAENSGRGGKAGDNRHRAHFAGNSNKFRDRRAVGGFLRGAFGSGADTQGAD